MRTANARPIARAAALGLVVVVVVAAGRAGAADAPATVPASRPAYAGAFEYRYPGFRVRADVIDARRMRWTILEGGDRVGESAEEQVDRRTVAPGVEFVSWTERDGTIVAQVVDLNAMRVHSVLVTGGRRLVFDGEIRRLGPAEGR